MFEIVCLISEKVYFKRFERIFDAYSPFSDTYCPKSLLLTDAMSPQPLCPAIIEARS